MNLAFSFAESLLANKDINLWSEHSIYLQLRSFPEEFNIIELL